VIKATPGRLPSGMSNLPPRGVVGHFSAVRHVSTARHGGAQVQMTGCFDDSRHMTVPPPSTAMSGNDDPGGVEVSAPELHVDRSIELCAADSAVDRFDEHLRDQPDEFDIESSKAYTAVVNSRFPGRGPGQPHHVIGPTGALNAAAQGDGKGHSMDQLLGKHLKFPRAAGRHLCRTSRQ
jgi:hypothetical protein